MTKYNDKNIISSLLYPFILFPYGFKNINDNNNGLFITMGQKLSTDDDTGRGAYPAHTQKM